MGNSLRPTSPYNSRRTRSRTRNRGHARRRPRLFPSTAGRDQKCRRRSCASANVGAGTRASSTALSLHPDSARNGTWPPSRTPSTSWGCLAPPGCLAPLVLTFLLYHFDGFRRAAASCGRDDDACMSGAAPNRRALASVFIALAVVRAAAAPIAVCAQLERQFRSSTSCSVAKVRSALLYSINFA